MGKLKPKKYLKILEKNCTKYNVCTIKYIHIFNEFAYLEVINFY